MIRHVQFEHTKGSHSNHPPRGQDGKWVQDMSYARRNTYIDRAQYENSWKVDRSDLLAFFRETLPGHPGCGSQKDVLGEKYNMSRMQKTFELQQRDDSKPYGNYSEYLASTRYLLKSKRSWNPYDIKHMNGTIEAYNSYSKSVFDERKGGGKLQVHWLNVYNSTILRRDGRRNFGGECILPSHLVFIASILILQTNDFLMFMSECAT